MRWDSLEFTLQCLDIPLYYVLKKWRLQSISQEKENSLINFSNKNKILPVYVICKHSGLKYFSLYDSNWLASKLRSVCALAVTIRWTSITQDPQELGLLLIALLTTSLISPYNNAVNESESDWEEIMRRAIPCLLISSIQQKVEASLSKTQSRWSVTLVWNSDVIPSPKLQWFSSCKGSYSKYNRYWKVKKQ